MWEFEHTSWMGDGDQVGGGGHHWAIAQWMLKIFLISKRCWKSLPFIKDKNECSAWSKIKDGDLIAHINA